MIFLLTINSLYQYRQKTKNQVFDIKQMCSIEANKSKPNKSKPWPTVPKECGYCDDEQDWTCSVCLEDAGPEYMLNEAGGVECVDSTNLQVVTSCGHRFHMKCLESYTIVRTNGHTTGIVPCPNCRNEVFTDNGNNAAMFEWWTSCICCARHQTNRPTTYAYDADVDNARKSDEQEEACRTLSAEEYTTWRFRNAARRERDLDNCSCNCRQAARDAIRRIPLP